MRRARSKTSLVTTYTYKQHSVLYEVDTSWWLPVSDDVGPPSASVFYYLRTNLYVKILAYYYENATILI